MRTTDTFEKYLEGLNQNHFVVLGIGGQRIAGTVNFMAGDYLTLTVDKSLVSGSGVVSLTDLPDRSRTTRIQVPLSAISWVARPEPE